MSTAHTERLVARLLAPLARSLDGARRHLDLAAPDADATDDARPEPTDGLPERPAFPARVAPLTPAIETVAPSRPTAPAVIARPPEQPTTDAWPPASAPRALATAPTPPDRAAAAPHSRPTPASTAQRVPTHAPEAGLGDRRAPPPPIPVAERMSHTAPDVTHRPPEGMHTQVPGDPLPTEPAPQVSLRVPLVRARVQDAHGVDARSPGMSAPIIGAQAPDVTRPGDAAPAAPTAPSAPPASRGAVPAATGTPALRLPVRPAVPRHDGVATPSPSAAAPSAAAAPPVDETAPPAPAFLPRHPVLPRIVAALDPVLEQAWRVTDAALPTAAALDAAPPPGTDTAASADPAGAPRVNNHFHVNVALGSDSAGSGRDPRQLEDALVTLLRDAARRQGLDV